MTARRLTTVERGNPFEVDVDGSKILAYEGETLATVLLAAGVRAFHHDAYGGPPSRLYCGMGVCMQCLATVDGVPQTQTCRTLARPHMKIETRR